MTVQFTRKLSVLLHADVVGSTSLVHLNEPLAHERMLAVFKRFSATIDDYGGVTREIRGDAIVASFERASDAVSAALCFQQHNEQYNQTLDDDILVRLRIGIGLGEVIIDSGTITGTGVVLAQRLEQLAEPGGVNIQSAVYESIPKGLPFEYESLGEVALKGFDLPVRAYAVSLRPGLPVPAAENNRKFGALPFPRSGLISALVLLAFSLAAMVWWQWSQQAEESEADKLSSANPGPSPVIAILPFDNLSDDAEQQYFSDGMTDDLITDLSRVSGLLVISRTSTFSFRGKSEDVRTIGQTLGARYVVEGSVRRARDTLRINAQLIDAETGLHLWAQRYDAPIEDIFTVQDNVTRQIVQALALKIKPGELEHTAKPVAVNLEAYDLFLQGSVTFQRFGRADTFAARRLFEQSLAIDPGFAQAHAMLAWTYAFEYTNGWSENPERTLQQGFDIANRSIAIDARLPVAYFVRGIVYRERRQFEKSIADARTAISIEPSYANAYVLLASVLYYTDRPREGLNLLRKATHLNPLHPSNYSFHIGQALFILERYEEAIEAFQQGILQNPTSQRLHVWLAATYAQVGNIEEAEWEASEILNEDPAFSLTGLESIFPFQNPADLKRFNNALARAGFTNLLSHPE